MGSFDNVGNVPFDIKVHAILAVTTKHSRDFETPLGLFRYSCRKTA